MDQTLTEDNRSDLEAVFFHIVMHVFDNCNLSQEIFAIDTWGAHAHDPYDYMEPRL